VIDIEYANPFVTATLDTLEAVAMARPRCGVPVAETGRRAAGSVRGVISFAGESVGHVAVTFPAPLARLLYRCMVGEEAPGLTAEVRDAVGEVANLIAGGAKARLSQRGRSFQLGIPQVIAATGPVADPVAPATCLVVPFSLHGETFWLELRVGSPGGVAGGEGW